jgi:hypothetical protein
LDEVFEKRPLAIPGLYAIPDPHIERWLLLDAKAFKNALGTGCKAPDKKCERDRYKRLLGDAVRKAGVSPIFNGMEHAEAIINEMDVQRIKHQDDSFGRFVQDMERMFSQWQKEKVNHE